MTTAIDPQVQLDDEMAGDFRRLTTRLRQKIRQHEIAEAKLRKLAKKARLDRQRQERIEERAIDEFDGDNRSYVTVLQTAQHDTEEAQLAESEAMNAYREEKLSRKQARLELHVAIKRFNVPLPLFDGRAQEADACPRPEEPSPEKPKRTRKKKVAPTSATDEPKETES